MGNCRPYQQAYCGVPVQDLYSRPLSAEQQQQQSMILGGASGFTQPPTRNSQPALQWESSEDRYIQDPYLRYDFVSAQNSEDQPPPLPPRRPQQVDQHLHVPQYQQPQSISGGNQGNNAQVTQSSGAYGWPQHRIYTHQPPMQRYDPHQPQTSTESTTVVPTSSSQPLGSSYLTPSNSRLYSDQPFDSHVPRPPPKPEVYGNVLRNTNFGQQPYVQFLPLHDYQNAQFQQHNTGLQRQDGSKIASARQAYPHLSQTSAYGPQIQESQPQQQSTIYQDPVQTYSQAYDLPPPPLPPRGSQHVSTQAWSENPLEGQLVETRGHRLHTQEHPTVPSNFDIHHGRSESTEQPGDHQPRSSYSEEPVSPLLDRQTVLPSRSDSKMFKASLDTIAESPRHELPMPEKGSKASSISHSRAFGGPSDWEHFDLGADRIDDIAVHGTRLAEGEAHAYPLATAELPATPIRGSGVSNANATDGTWSPSPTRGTPPLDPRSSSLTLNASVRQPTNSYVPALDQRSTSNLQSVSMSPHDLEALVGAQLEGHDLGQQLTTTNRSSKDIIIVQSDVALTAMKEKWESQKKLSDEKQNEIDKLKIQCSALQIKVEVAEEAFLTAQKIHADQEVDFHKKISQGTAALAKATEYAKILEEEIELEKEKAAVNAVNTVSVTHGLEPWFEDSLERYKEMLQVEAKPLPPQEQVQLFLDFVNSEARLRGIDLPTVLSGHTKGVVSEEYVIVESEPELQYSPGGRPMLNSAVSNLQSAQDNFLATQHMVQGASRSDLPHSSSPSSGENRASRRLQVDTPHEASGSQPPKNSATKPTGTQTVAYKPFTYHFGGKAVSNSPSTQTLTLPSEPSTEPLYTPLYKPPNPRQLQAQAEKSEKEDMCEDMAVHSETE